MKWLPANGSTQGTSDGRYVIVNATSQHWIAYELTPYASFKELGNKPTDSEARQVCEDHEALLVSARQIA